MDESTIILSLSVDQEAEETLIVKAYALPPIHIDSDDTLGSKYWIEG
jgi:hypothetical protein